MLPLDTSPVTHNTPIMQSSFDFSDPSEKKPSANAQPNTPADQVAELTRTLEHHNRLYYIEAQPEISDAEYDRLLNELKQLEAQHPELLSPHSPTQRVGGAPLKHFEQRAHLRPMLSIEDVHELKPQDESTPHHTNADSAAPLIQWFEKLQKDHPNTTVTIEPKIDGVAVTLIYKNRQLDYALTRGDGTRGDDITQNVRTIRSIPLTLPDSAPDLFEVRGEIFMENEAFALLNVRRDEVGEPAFVNPRNATAGTLKQLDSKLVAARPIDCIFHSYGDYSNSPQSPRSSPFTDLLNFQDTLRHYHLKATHWHRTASTACELLAAIVALDADRHAFPYATDGAVIKVNDITLHDTIGYTAKFPKWACAFKFLPQQAETTLDAITIQVGRTGVLTPVAELSPVFISGTTVSRATLHNQDEITRKDIRISDTVVVEKAGEIIPSVVRVIMEKRPPAAANFDLFTHVQGRCPSCQEPISKEDGFTAWRCTNFTCPAQAATKATHFASRKALDISGLGESVATKLVENELIQNPLDIFDLQRADLANLMLDPAKSSSGDTISKERRFGEKRADTLLTSLQSARELPLHRWIYAFGFPHIGESAAKELARLHSSIEELATSPTLLALAHLPEDESLKKSERKKENHALLAPLCINDSLGPVAAASILAELNSPHGTHIIAALHEHSISPTSSNYAPEPKAVDPSSSPLAGKTFVITGSLSKPRPEIKKDIEAAGGKVTGSVSKKTDYLVSGDASGNKLDKALSLGVPVLNEEALAKLIQP